ncbi:uncharacterized protein [Nicotiana sylvestris]|uniref:uncharacterized protein n=1 Tax=Nicotiana sylvestris TaxID=4096 RepID=UPI00388CA7A2
MGVDKTKTKVISILPPTTSVKGVRRFLGHVGFYRRLIKDFSKVVNPLCKLFEKYAKIVFNDNCIKAFELLKYRLTATPIITAPNWSLPFELKCDASDMAVGAVLGQRINKIFLPVYYASKTMNDAQVNYMVIDKELLAIIFSMEKFNPYLMGNKVIVHTDHVAHRYLMSKNDSKARLMWMPWFADVANYLVSKIVPNEFSSNQIKKLKRDCLDYYWDEPYLFKIFNDGVIRRCAPEEEQLGILEACHSSPYGDHHGWAKTATKYDDCLRANGISKKNEMSLTTILEVDIFDVWGIDFMGPFVSSCEKTYIFVVVDYVSKWVEDVDLPNNEARSVVSFLKNNIFTRFDTPRSIISDGGSHFSNKAFDTLLSKYGVTHKLVFGKACHLPVELENKAMWALKMLNLEWDAAANLRVEQLNELDEFWFHANSSSSLYKDKMKYLHDKHIRNREFKEGDLVLLFNSRLWMFSGKLKSNWSGPFKVVHVTPFRALDLKNKNGEIFKVNVHQVKHCLVKVDDSHVVALIHFK